MKLASNQLLAKAIPGIISNVVACKESPGLVDFAIRLVNSVLNLPNGQVAFFEESN